MQMLRIICLIFSKWCQKTCVNIITYLENSWVSPGLLNQWKCLSPSVRCVIPTITAQESSADVRTGRIVKGFTSVRNTCEEKEPVNVTARMISMNLILWRPCRTEACPPSSWPSWRIFTLILKLWNICPKPNRPLLQTPLARGRGEARKHRIRDMSIKDKRVRQVTHQH